MHLNSGKYDPSFTKCCLCYIQYSVYIYIRLNLRFIFAFVLNKILARLYLYYPSTQNYLFKPSSPNVFLVQVVSSQGI